MSNNTASFDTIITNLICSYTIDIHKVFTKKKELLKGVLRKIPCVKYSAHECTIRNVPKKVAEKFLCENHLVGAYASDLYVGLFYEGELIAVSAFTLYEDTIIWNRHATKLGILVHGGLTKILATFTCDIYTILVKNKIFNNSMYNTLGFKLYKDYPSVSLMKRYKNEI